MSKNIDDYRETVCKAFASIISGFMILILYVGVPIGLVYVLLSIILYPFGIKL